MLRLIQYIPLIPFILDGFQISFYLNIFVSMIKLVKLVIWAIGYGLFRLNRVYLGLSYCNLGEITRPLASNVIPSFSSRACFISNPP